ncbi:hypothetical protein RH915_07025 [Serpentinicella sp. ANB-PHB4]|uniref:hypothetical protein n=1 Tax=Serpentinicella sp. ANB-PHB4 TaxID=3074076 RepID=UPI00286478F1|nr:hypothetical protein [Serpentinicella sp. ANB-PHB4]MDR5659239.1 hypothetical protein [Serpentinicella sp. ANB-PHB4]
MSNCKVIKLDEFRNRRLKNNRNSPITTNSLYSVEDDDRIRTLNLFMKVLENIHKESHKKKITKG